MALQPDIVYGTGNGRPLRLDIFQPDQQKSLRTAVLQLHGGGWCRGDRKMLRAHSEKLSSLGFTCCTFFRRIVSESDIINKELEEGQ